jgi:signal transduction histidine kinase/CheY-like chemotaxis protein
MKSDQNYSSLNVLLDNIEGTNLLLEYYSDFTKRILESRDFKAIIAVLYEELRKIYIKQQIEYLLWHPNSKLVKLEYQPKLHKVTPAEEFTESNTLYHYVLEQKQIVLTNNYQQFCNNLGVHDKGLNASSWLALPMIVKGKVLGMLVVWDSNPEHYFRLQDKQFLTTVTNIAGFALENIYLYDYIVEKSDSFRFIEGNGSERKPKKEFKEPLQQLLYSACRSAKSEYTSIFVRSQNIERWKLTEEYYENEDLDNLSLEMLKSLIYIKEETLQSSGYFLYHKDYQNHPLKPVFKDLCTKYNISSFLIFPFKISHLYYGLWIISFGNIEKPPNPEELEFLRNHFILITQLIEKRILEEHKEKYESYIQHLEKMKVVGELASGSAHHLNNILSVILGRAQILFKKLEGSPYRKDLKLIEQAAEDGAKAVQRLQSVKVKNEPISQAKPLQINDLLQEVVDIARPRFEREAQSSGIVYDLQLTLGDIEQVKGDAAALREVFLNLLNNGLDAMPKGGKLTIQTIQKDDKILVFFSDTGIGIDEKIRDKIFEPFFSTKGEKGNGLGLSIGVEIIDRHQGRIYVDSIPQKGSIFLVELPTVKEEPVKKEDKPGISEDIACHVLLVDDENEVRETLGEMLEDEGCQVTMAGNTEEAYNKFQEIGCDVVLTDLSMPGANGLELAKRIKSVRQDVPVVLITGWNQVDRHIFEQGDLIAGIIEKPFNMKQIKKQFTAVLKRNGKFAKSSY